VKLPSYNIKTFEKRLAWPAKDWPLRCHEVAWAIVAAGLVKGRAVYGHYLGLVHEDSPFKVNGFGVQRHGWIVGPKDIIVDPTRWVFEAKPPYIYVGKASGEYDEGGNQLRMKFMRPAPVPGVDDQRTRVKEASLPLLRLLAHRLSDPDVVVGLTKDQARWIANLPPDMLKPYTKQIYTWLKDGGRAVWVPIDNYRKVMGEDG
jgi:hypothetical protein